MSSKSKQLRKQPPKGFRDILPEQATLRDEVLDTISSAYRLYGFERIETPSIESSENIRGNLGGENEKLVFEILKRGASRDAAISKLSEDASYEILCDGGLRYDLTMPLSRFYAANADKLPIPFRAFQFGDVWRAEKPAAGRFRQFKQCDIDILGEKSIYADAEVMSAGISAVSAVCRKFSLPAPVMKVNDRRLLESVALACGFAQEEVPGLLVELDRADKIGLDGVAGNLREMFPGDGRVERYVGFYESLPEDCAAEDFLAAVGALWGEVPAEIANVISDMDRVINLASLSSDGGKFEFCPTLVRGMGYYTGIVYEVALDGYSSSFGGGGRYDSMVSRFGGGDVPACGFSIGFERLANAIEEKVGGKASEDGGGVAFVIGKQATPEDIGQAFGEAKRMRAAGCRVVVEFARRNLGRQLTELEERGFREIIKVF